MAILPRFFNLQVTNHGVTRLQQSLKAPALCAQVVFKTTPCAAGTQCLCEEQITKIALLLASIFLMLKVVKNTLLEIMQLQLQDNTKARVINKNLDNSYRKRGNRKKIRSQIAIYQCQILLVLCPLLIGQTKKWLDLM